MSHLSSINFKKSVDYQVFHNSTSRPNYAIGGELEYNRKGYEALKLKEQIIAEAKQTYTKTTGQKWQADRKDPNDPEKIITSYEWSAVVNIKPETTMQDLERLAKHFSDKYGFQCYQIAIHRDEGHINDDGEKIINHHAHLEFVMLDKETGKTCFKKGVFGKAKMREIQTEVAEILGMQRGQDKRLSGAKRIEPRQYAKIKEAERAERKAQQDTQLTKPLTKKEVESTIKTFIQHTKDQEKQAQLIEYFREVKKIKKADFNITADTLGDKIADILGFESMQELLKAQKADLEKQKEYLKQLETLQKENDSLKTQNKALQEQNDTLNDKIHHLEQEKPTESKFDPLVAKLVVNQYTKTKSLKDFYEKPSQLSVYANPYQLQKICKEIDTNNTELSKYNLENLYPLFEKMAKVAKRVLESDLQTARQKGAELFKELFAPSQAKSQTTQKSQEQSKGFSR